MIEATSKAQRKAQHTLYYISNQSHMLIILLAVAALFPTSVVGIDLPCILLNGCVCNHTLPFNNTSDGQTYGTCTACDDGYTGPTCARPRVDCQNLGTVLPNGTCECQPQWNGPTCIGQLCINSVNGVGPTHTRVPNPKTNFCDQCLPGFGGTSCDICIADAGCSGATGGPKCGRAIAVPQTNKYNLQCAVTSKAFLGLLGPKRNIEARVDYECVSPSSFKDAGDAECAVSFYRIEENSSWVDPFFYCTGFDCSVTETSTSQATGEDTTSPKYKFFEFIKVAGQVSLLVTCFLISVAKYIPGPASAQRVAVKISITTLFIVLLVYIFIVSVVMSSPNMETISQVSYTCERTACICGPDPPSAAYSPVCSDSNFGKLMLPTITQKTSMQCNSATGACTFIPEDMPTIVDLQCEASECIQANATQSSGASAPSPAARGGSWLVLLLGAIVAISFGLLHYTMVSRQSKMARIEFNRKYVSNGNKRDQEPNDAGRSQEGTSRSAAGRRSHASSVDMGDIPPSDDDALDDDEFHESDGLARNTGIGGGLGQVSVASPLSVPSSGSNSSDNEAEARGAESAATTYTLRAERLGYSVPTSDWPWQKHKVKTILQEVSFSATSGDVVALMGSSGAGKTTLLDILAARQKSGAISGDITLGGASVLEDAARYRALVGYVAQEDTLLPNLTVRQTLLYAARLKLPNAFSSRTIRLIIEELMAAMGITRCANTIIGDGANSRGLSGGEKRRVSIAVELVANPRILFLDEPTSGLDASSALKVMEAVSLLAHTSPLAKHAPNYFTFKPIIIASIHQPSTAIFSRFTTLVLMSRGLAIYAGPRAEALDTLAKALGRELKCDNPAEGLLLIDDSVSDSAREELADAAAVLNERPNHSRSATDVSSGERLLTDVQALKRFYASPYEQLALLTRRSHASLMGSYYLIAAHGLVTVFMGGLMCILYSAEPLSLPGALNRAGSITFLLLVQSFISLSALEQLMMERKLFITERENGFYTTMPYLLSKLVVDVIPLRVVPAVVVGAIIYFPMGLRTDEGSYFLWFLTIIALFTVCISLCVLCIGVLTPNFGTAALISAVAILWNFVFGGLLVQADTIPAVLQPFRKASPFYAAFEALLVNELDGQMCTFAPTDAAGRPSDTVIPLFCVQYLYNLGLHPDRFINDLLILVCESVLFIFIAYLLLRRARLTR